MVLFYICDFNHLYNQNLFFNFQQEKQDSVLSWNVVQALYLINTVFEMLSYSTTLHYDTQKEIMDTSMKTTTVQQRGSHCAHELEKTEILKQPPYFKRHEVADIMQENRPTVKSTVGHGDGCV